MNFLFPSTLNRKQYALRLLTLLILVLALVLLSSLIEISVALLFSTHHTRIGLPALLPLLLLMIAPLLLALCRIPCLDMPRLRSIGWSCWLVLLFLIPVVNLILQICLFSMAPTVDFSEDQPEGRRSPEVRVLFWSIGILVMLVLANGAFFMYVKSHPIRYPGAVAHSQAPQPATTQAEAAPEPEPLKLTNSNLHVESIFYLNSPRSSAVVNQNSVMVGDHVGKWVVAGIGSNSVTFRNADGETPIVRGK